MIKHFGFVFSILISVVAGANGPTLKIGNQEWASENLSVTKFRNGEEIPQAKNLKEWQDATENYKPVWCYPDFNEANAGVGKIYNYYAVSNEKKICPEGFHIPTPAEWRSLVETVNTSGKLDAGRKLKGKTGWKTINERNNGTDEYGFNSRPGGYISYKEGYKYENRTFSYINLETCASYWANSSNQYNVASGDFSAFMLSSDYSYVQMHDRNFKEGYFVRCIKNNSDFKELTYYPNEFFTYHYWMTENLNVKSFKNGESIPYAKNKKEWVKYAKAKTAACCSVNFDSKNDNEFGLLYNWYAVADPRGLAPEGWRIPNYNEWYNLNSKLKEKYPNSNSWMDSKTWNKNIGTNESGFKGKAAGFVSDNGGAVNFGTQASWWHSDDVESSTEYAFKSMLNENGFSTAEGISSSKGSGLSVRCIKE